MMPGVFGRATVEIEPDRTGKRGWIGSRENIALPSPIKSLLASLNRRVSITKDLPLRKKMATRALRHQDIENVGVGMDQEAVCHMATDWAEVIFFHQGSQVVDPLRVQGWRQERAGVSIIPEWQPPSPVMSSFTISSRNPKTLLHAPLVRVPYSSDSQGDEESDDSGDDLYEPPLPFPNGPTLVRLSQTEVKTPSLNTLFSPSSPLSTCNIKALLTSSKFLALPATVQKKLLSYLPVTDQQTLARQLSSNLDTILHNEYISAALREWQDRLILGALQRKRSHHHTSSMPWKDKFYEEYWGDNRKRIKLEKDDEHYYPSSPTAGYDHKQKLVHQVLFRSSNHKMSKSKSTSTRNNSINHLPVINGSCHLTTPPSPNPALPVQLPLQAYTVHCTSQQILQEHSYCSTRTPLRSTLTLIIGSKCNCQTIPLQVCPTCHRLYHPKCSEVPRCPACTGTTH